jgi:hypothetical protein
MLGESLVTVERKLDEAERLFTSPEADEQSQLGSYFTQGALITRRACCYVEAGKPARAAELFGDVLNGDGLSLRDKGFFRALRSYACALSGEPDLAAEEALSAFTVATTTNSERTTRELARTAKALVPWSSRPGPRQLREALAGHA